VIDRDIFFNNDEFKDMPRAQDTEFTERLVRQGEQLLFFPDIVGHQIVRSTLKELVRKIYINGKNIFTARYKDKNIFKKIFIFLLLPVIAITKATRINCRNIRYAGSVKLFFNSILVTTVIYVCSFVWVIGFAKEILFNDKASSK
jgi:hypothetical protein